MEEFHKVRRLPQYVFEQVNRLKASARAAGADIIDLGMAIPTFRPPKRSSTSFARSFRIRAPIVIPRPRAFPVFAARRQPIMPAVSA